MDDKPLEFGVSYLETMLSSCFKLKSLNKKSGDPLVKHSHSVCSMHCWQTLLRNHHFPFQIYDFPMVVLYFFPWILLKTTSSSAHLQKRVVLWSARGSSGDQTCLIFLAAETLLFHLPLNVTCKSDAKIKGMLWINSKTLRSKNRVCEYECRCNIKLDIGCRGRIKDIGQVDRHPQNRATATPLKSENSREKLPGTSGKVLKSIWRPSPSLFANPNSSFPKL